MSLLAVAGANSSVGGYDVDNSLKFEADNSEGLTFTPSSTTNNKVWTFSAWIKRTELGVSNHTVFGHYTDGDNHTIIRFDGGDKLDVRNTVSTTVYQLDTDMVFRDTSAWYHIVVAFDTTQSTAANRTKVYVNGSQVDLSGTYTAQNVVTYINTASKVESIGVINSTEYNSGYMAEINFVDGSQLDATSFGEYDSDSGIWIPKEYTGTYGTNGFYLDFEDAANLGDDESGNSNDWTEVNITAADQATDTPTNNFCTFNPLIATSNAPTINEGAMHVAGGGGTWNNAYGSLGAKNGKWYYEYKVTNTEFGFFGASTFPDTSDDATSSQFMYDQSFTIGYAAAHYYQRINGSQISNEGTGWGTTAVNDIYGLFLNLDDQEFTVFRNGTELSGTLSQPVSLNSAFDGKFVFPTNTQYEDDGGEFNFGGYTLISNTKSYNDANGHGAFVYSPVLSGVNYYALCSKNLAEYG